MIEGFFNGGYVIETVPNEIFDIIKKEAFNAKTEKESFSSELAGNIEEEYIVNFKNKSEYRLFENYIFYLVSQYEKQFNYLRNVRILNKPLPYGLQPMWVNFQKKYEFNPLHDHDGLWSFVIWVQIPYLIEEEYSHPSVAKSNYKSAGNFSFVYPTLHGVESIRIPTDKTFEKKIILFPSALKHLVYPFYSSDEYRVSVSGNIQLVVS